ncbi:MAG: hypothetical protein AAF939_14680 [Planctomycetota bacterium]
MAKTYLVRILVAIPLGALLLGAAYITSFVGIVMMLLVTDPMTSDPGKEWIDQWIVPAVIIILSVGVVVPWGYYLGSGRLDRSLIIACFLFSASYVLMVSSFLLAS